MSRLIITNGDCAIARMQAAGMAGTLLPWRDALHDGPVPRAASLEALSAIRARSMARLSGRDQAKVAHEFSQRDDLFRRHSAFERVEIWLEHDLYDQLQLVQILGLLAGSPREGLFLVQADDHLGTQGEAELSRLACTSAPVTQAQLALADRAWRAFTAETPEELTSLLAEGLSALPYLRPSLLRLLAELPDEGGLTRTERLALDAIAHGHATPGLAFKRMSESEDAHFMGDLSFFRRLEAMVFAERPLVAGLPHPFDLASCGADTAGYENYTRRQLALTADGHAALDGRFDFAAVRRDERWLGGTLLVPPGLWRWDRAAARLLAP